MKNGITIGFPVMNLHDLTIDCLRLIERNTNRLDEIIIIDNGSVQPLQTYPGFAELKIDTLEKIKIIRNKENIGVRDAINQIWKAASNPYILLMHNDVQILDPNWDERVRTAFAEIPEAGIVGCYGSKGLGTADLYQAPYEMHQLARQLNVSGSSMDKNVHGFRELTAKFENVAVFDGFALVVKKKLLDEMQGLSAEVLEVHHFYDMYICIESLKRGYENIVIPLDFYHLGGRTDVSQPWAKDKQQVHTDAHPRFYEYGKGVLPARIIDVFNDGENKLCGYQLFMGDKLVKEKIYE